MPFSLRCAATSVGRGFDQEIATGPVDPVMTHRSFFSERTCEPLAAFPAAPECVRYVHSMFPSFDWTERNDDAAILDAAELIRSAAGSVPVHNEFQWRQIIIQLLADPVDYLLSEALRRGTKGISSRFSRPTNCAVDDIDNLEWGRPSPKRVVFCHELPDDSGVDLNLRSGAVLDGLGWGR